MNTHSISRMTIAVLLCALLSACADGIPKDALQLTQDSLERRQLQSRVYDTKDEAAILAASAAVLQDLGFNLDESETRLGVIVSSKRRDAMEAGQVTGAIVMGLIFGAPMTVDKVQRILASLVTRPSGQGGERMTVRITFQRTVWNTEGKVSRVEPIDEPGIYQEFFTRLSKSVFLEAHKI